jgi:hypothetical protein
MKTEAFSIVLWEGLAMRMTKTVMRAREMLLGIVVG